MEGVRLAQHCQRQEISDHATKGQTALEGLLMQIEECQEQSHIVQETKQCMLDCLATALY